MNPVQEKMIAEMGIGPIWKLLPHSLEKESLSQTMMPKDLLSTSSRPSGLQAQVEMENGLNTQLHQAICQVCGWRPLAPVAIPSETSPDVNYFFIHEHSDDNEIATVSALTGTADTLLKGILRELHIQRGVSAYLASIVKKKPVVEANKRLSRLDGEIMACVSCTKQQIELIRPSVIISLGNIAAMSLLDLEGNSSINDLRGTLYRYQEIPLIVTHELNYLLQHPKEKHSLWSDLCFAMKAIQVH